MTEETTLLERPSRNPNPSAFAASCDLDLIACDIDNLAAVARLASTAEPLDEAAQRALAGIADMAASIADRAYAASSRYVGNRDHVSAQPEHA